MWLRILLLCSLSAAALAQNVKCGGGWTQHNGQCFTAVSKAKSWTKARADCQAKHGDLVVLPDQATADVLVNMLSGIKKAYWIGLQDLKKEGKFKWVDGSTLGYKNFVTPEPNNQGNEDCVAMKPFTKTGEWNDDGCGNSKPYICGRDAGYVPQCDESNGWRSFNKKCYRFFTDTQSWNDAELRCASFENGHLAIVSSSAIQDFLDNHQLGTFNTYWIGLTDKKGGTDGQYEWSDGSTYKALVPSKWATGQPINSWYGNDGDCSYVNSKGKWSIAVCTPAWWQTGYNYFCEVPEGNCAPGWTKFAGNCYQVNSKVLKTWTNAKDFCTNQGTNLISINTASENEFLGTFLSSLSVQGIARVYIGISDAKDGTFKWADSKAVPGYTHWEANNPPKANKKMDCGFVMTANFNNTRWLAGDCFMQNAYICKVAVGTPVMYVAPTAVSGSCDSEWDLFNKRCYKFVQKEETWNNAKTECINLNAKLAKVPDEKVQSFISGRLDALKSPIWIGLNDKVKEGIYKWADDTDLDTSKQYWASNQPGSQDCVVMKGTIIEHSLWKTQYCFFSEFYACEKQAKAGVQPIVPVPTVTYLERCGNGWEYDKKSKKCFVFRPSASKNWFDARFTCRQEGGDLMSLQGNDDFGYAKSRLEEYGQGYSWIGCNDLGVEGGWVWSDKKAFSLLNWAPDEPNNLDNYFTSGEHCCTMYNSGGDWNDEHCQRYTGYSCNRDEFIFKFFLSFTEKKLTGTSIVDDLIIQSVWPLECAKRCVYEKSFVCLSFDYDRAMYTCYLRKINRNSAGVQLLPTFDSQHFDYYERDSQVLRPPAPTPLPLSMGCPTGWALYSSTCFLVGTTYIDKPAAEAACQKNGAMLASIRDRNTNNFLRALIYEQNQQNNNFWIGLSDLNQEALFEWSNGDPVTFTNWNAHEPNDVQHDHIGQVPVDGEDCTELYHDSGFWNDLPCTGHNNMYLCSKPPSAGGSQPSNGKCPKSWVQWADRCFQFSSKKASWNDAGTKCKTTPGAQLVVVDYSDKLAYLSSQLGLLDKDEYYIALSDTKTPGFYEWMDGTPMTSTNWDDGQPDDRTGHCVTMNSGVDAGYFRDRNCTQQYYFICEKALTNDPVIQPPTIPTPTQPSDTDCQISTGWFGYGSRCFKAFMFDNYYDKTYWIDANRVCINSGGALASFHHPDEEAFVSAKINSTEIFWIGLNDERQGFVWSDDTVVQYTNWATNEPSYYGRWKECVETDMSGGKWNEQYCWYNRNFICSIAKGITPMTTPVPTPAVGDDCPGNLGWKFLDGNCYYFGRFSWQNWGYAKENCHDEGAHLVSIHSEAEQKFLNDRIIDGDYWIGLRANVSHPGDFKWADGSYLDYVNWDGVQDTTGGYELCVHLVTSSQESKGKWKIQNCGDFAEYICKKDINGPEPTHAPKPPLKGGCPSGWKQYYDKRCYKQMGLGGGGDPKLNWVDARKKCLDLDGHLASIHSLPVKMELTADMIDAKDDQWIGLSTKTSPNYFLWTDNSAFDYGNYAYGQGWVWNSNANISYCVYMLKEDGETGKWHKGDCDVLHGYLCMKEPEERYPVQPVTRPDCKDMPGKGYVQYGNVCFRIYSDKKRTFEEAKNICAADGAGVTVASILNGYEQAMVETFLLYDDKIDTNVWIGMHFDEINSTLGWIDGFPQHFSHWGWDNPKSLGCAAIEYTAYYYYYPGEWVNVDCSNKYYAACKYNEEKPPIPEPEVPGICEPGWTAFGSSCYILGTGRYEQATYKEAYYDCHRIYGGAHTVSIGSKAENTFVTNFVRNKITAYWILIGLERTPSGGWEWEDGKTPLTYVNWGADRPDLYGCAEIQLGAKGKWWDVSCDVSSHYVCEKPKQPGNFTTVGPVKPTPGAVASLGGGAIAGIVIGVLVLVVLLAIVVGYLVLRSRQPMKAPMHEASFPPTTGFDNVLYAPSADDVKTKPADMSEA